MADMEEDETNTQEEQQYQSMVDVSSRDTDHERIPAISTARMMGHGVSYDLPSITFNDDNGQLEGLNRQTSGRSLCQASIGDISFFSYDGGGLTSAERKAFRSTEDVEGLLAEFAVSKTYQDTDDFIPHNEYHQKTKLHGERSARKTDWNKMYLQAMSPPYKNDDESRNFEVVASTFEDADMAPLTGKIHDGGNASDRLEASWGSHTNPPPHSTNVAPSSDRSTLFLPPDRSSIPSNIDSIPVDISGTDFPSLGSILNWDSSPEEGRSSSAAWKSNATSGVDASAAPPQFHGSFLEFLAARRVAGGAYHMHPADPERELGSSNYPAANTHLHRDGEQSWFPKADHSSVPEKPHAVPATTTTRKQIPEVKEYVDQILDNDVLCGRGGRANNHVGNQVYLARIAATKPVYRDTKLKSEKTKIAQTVVDFIVKERMGRFLELERETERWFVVQNRVARIKAGQALRDDNTPEGRAAKRKKYSC